MKYTYTTCTGTHTHTHTYKDERTHTRNTRNTRNTRTHQLFLGTNLLEIFRLNNQ